MNIYTTYTPSHKILYDNYFIKTLPKDFNLKAYADPEQLCKTGEYYTNGWTQTTKKKIDIFVYACAANIGKPFFYCDVDVQFFDNNIINILLEELGDYDIACQDDYDNYNSGVFVCNANETTLAMFKQMQKTYNYIDDDQRTLNKHLFMCKHKMLSRRFFTTGFIFRRWNGQDFELPKDIIMHHANWIVGVPDKIKVLDFVRSKYDQRYI